MLRPDDRLLEPLEQAVAVDWLDERGAYSRGDQFCLLMAKKRFRNVVRECGRFTGPVRAHAGRGADAAGDE